MFDKAQLPMVREIIDNTPSGVYTVREMFGPKWGLIHRKRAFGQWFRAAVKASHLPRVRWVGTRSDNSHLYEILPPALGAARVEEERPDMRPHREPAAVKRIGTA